MVVLWVLLLAAAAVQADWNIQQHLGTQSPYWSENSTAQTPAPEGCNLIHLDLLSRHGSRYPTNGDINLLITLTGLIKKYNQYIPDSFSYIKNWTNPYPLNQQGFLSTSGQEELYELGQRYNSTYYPLFSQPYYPDVYVLQSTQVPRTGVSASSFVQGFLQGEGAIGSSNYQPVYIFSNTPSLDPLRFFDNCPVYSQARSNGTIGIQEADIYADANYPAISQRIAQLLGVAPYWNITVDHLDAMFTACGFEVSVFHKTDGWCSIFSPDDVNIYEYAGDLEAYWVKSYGAGIGYQISAVVLQSIVSTMDSVISNATGFQQQKAYLRFSHAEDILPLAALLGLFKDDYDLRANTSSEQIQNRKWTASVISPFGANIAMALYDCGSGEFKVKLTHNEVEYVFPGCSDLYCPYSEFKALYAQALSFNFSRSCAVPAPFHHKESVSLAVFTGSVIGAFAGGALLVFIFARVYISRRGGYGTLQNA